MEVAFGVILLLALFGGVGYAVNEWRKNMALLRSVTDVNRGTWSERRSVVRLLKLDVAPITLYHDLYVEKSPGQYAQIDAVVVTKVGIIVFEIKDYSGWIFGSGYQKYWMQILAYGREKHRFYNPVLQNKGHIEALKERLKGIADVPFYSVIVFYGNCTLREINHLPPSTFIGYPGSLKSIMDIIVANNPPAHYNDKWGVVNALREAVANGNNPEVVRCHARRVRNYSR